MPDKKYKWATPQEWLIWALYSDGGIVVEQGEVESFIAKLDPDVIQEHFQEAMDEYGYFKEVDDDGEFTEEDEEDEELLECEVCGEEADESESTSTYCGTIHYACLFKHMKECEPCGKDDYLRNFLSTEQRKQLDKIWKEED